MARTVRLDLDQEHLTVAPGQTARLALTLRNTSDVVEHLQVEVRGLPPGAQAVTDPPTVKLLPGATAQCTTTLELPATPAADAGPHVLGVLARSPHRREVSRCEEVRLDVPALPGLSLTVEPELVRTGGRAGFTATLVNEGNTTLRVALAGSDPERLVRFRITPPDVVLRPRQTAQAAVTVLADRPWTGQEARRPLTLTASDAAVSAASTATLVQPPRLPPVVLRSLAGVVGLLLLAGTFLLVELVKGGDADGGKATAEGAPTAPVSPGAEPSAPQSSTAPTPTLPPPPSTGGPSTGPSAPPSAEPSPSELPSVLPPEPKVVPLTDGRSSPQVRPQGPSMLTPAFDVVAAPPSVGAPPGCEAAQPAVHETGDADFVTAVAPTDPALCRDVPLTLTFLDAVQPVSDVVLEVIVDGDYLISTVTESGPVEAAPVTAQHRMLSVVGERIRTLTVGPGPGSGAPAQFGLVRVKYTPAPSS